MHASQLAGLLYRVRVRIRVNDLKRPYGFACSLLLLLFRL